MMASVRALTISSPRTCAIDCHVSPGFARYVAISLGRMLSASTRLRGRNDRILRLTSPSTLEKESGWSRPAEYVHVLSISDVRHSRGDITNSVSTTDVGTQIRVQSVDAGLPATASPVPRIPHGLFCNPRKIVTLRVLGQLKQHIRLGPWLFGHDHGLTVPHFPTCRKRECKPQRRVQELAASHDAVLRIVAESKTFDPVKIPGSIDTERPRIPTGHELLNHGPNFDDASLRLWVGRQKVRSTLPVSRLANPTKSRQHVGDTSRVPPTCRAVLRTQAIGLDLVISAELQKEKTKTSPGSVTQPWESIRVRAHLRHEDLPENHPELGTARSRVRLDTVSRRHVTDLMSQDSRQLRLIAQIRHDSACQIDEPPRAGRMH